MDWSSCDRSGPRAGPHVIDLDLGRHVIDPDLGLGLMQFALCKFSLLNITYFAAFIYNCFVLDMLQF